MMNGDEGLSFSLFCEYLGKNLEKKIQYLLNELECKLNVTCLYLKNKHFFMENQTSTVGKPGELMNGTSVMKVSWIMVVRYKVR